jgi:integrase
LTTPRRWVTLEVVEAVDDAAVAAHAALLVSTFLRFSVDGAEKAMASACKAAEIPRFSPHDLRHRRATHWHHDGVPTKALAERVGHADAMLTLNTYSHVLDPEELSQESLEALLVWSPCGLEVTESPQSADSSH